MEGFLFQIMLRLVNFGIGLSIVVDSTLKKTGLNINGQSINEIGMSFGLGIPAGGLFSNVNATVELGKRGTTNADLVEENFINFQMSLSLNDRWFVKRKYN